MKHWESPPAVSVLICTYNAARFLPRAVSSALAQQYARGAFEVIVVDDGSTDETASVLAGFGNHLRVVERSHEGLPAACNAGITACRGDLLIRLDADDEMVPGTLDRLSSALLAAGDAVMAIADRRDVIVQEKRESNHPVSPTNLFDVIAPGVMFDVDTLRDAGGYRDFYWEEYDLYMRLKDRGEVVHVNEVLYRYYLHGQNMTASSEARRRGWRALITEWGIERLRELGCCEEMEDVWRAMSNSNRPAPEPPR